MSINMKKSYKCLDYNKLISSYIDNSLNEAESISVERHIQSCQNCKIEMMNLYTIRNMIKSVYFPKDEISLSSKIMNNINKTNYNINNILYSNYNLSKRSYISKRLLAYSTIAILMLFALGSTILYSQAQNKKLLAKQRNFDSYLFEHSSEKGYDLYSSSEVISVNFEQ